MNALGYVRVSTPSQAKEGESLKTQREAIENYAKEKGWKLLDIHADEGISGAKSDRPALTKLLEDVRKKQAEFIIIHRLSRFGRNARDLLNNVEVLKENGAKLVSLKDGIDYSTPYGQAMLTVLAAIAQLERDIIDEQMKENKLARWKDGRAIVGRLPFAFRWNKQNKEIEVVQKEADLYHRIVAMYLDEGKSFGDIALQLKDEGAKCRRKPWSSATISYLLKNPIYYGHYVVNRTKYDGKRRTKEQKPASEHITLKIDNPIISKTRWDQIQERTQFNKTKGKHITISEDYFLRDVIICGECGGAIKPRHGNKRNDGSRPRYYSCYWRGTSEKDLKVSAKKRCHLPYIKADEIEGEVWYYLTSFLTLQKVERKSGSKHHPTPFHELFDSKKYEQKLTQLESQITEFENEIKKKERSRQRLYAFLEEEQDYSNEFLQRLRKIDEDIFTFTSKIKDAKNKIGELRESKENDHLYKDFLSNRKGFIKRLITDLQNLSPKGKKQLVEGMLREKIRIWSGTDGNHWDAETPKLRFNKDILNQFIEDGQVQYSNKNTTNHPAGYEL